MRRKVARGTSGKVGSCSSPPGPPRRNLVTRGSKTPLMTDPDRRVQPGQVPTHLIGNDAVQEADNVGITALGPTQLPR